MAAIHSGRGRCRADERRPRPVQVAAVVRASASRAASATGLPIAIGDVADPLAPRPHKDRITGGRKLEAVRG
jgi:hypothetical protein